MNSTARRVPRITGLPARTSGSTTIRSEGGIFTVYATNQRRGGCRKLLRSLHRPTFAGGARNPLLRYGRPTSTATSPPESPGAVIALARGLESPPWHYCCDREIQFRSLNSTPSRSWLCSEPRASVSRVLTAPNLTVAEPVWGASMYIFYPSVDATDTGSFQIRLTTKNVSSGSRIAKGMS